jgi:hypothetical protein
MQRLSAIWQRSGHLSSLAGRSRRPLVIRTVIPNFGKTRGFSNYNFIRDSRTMSSSAVIRPVPPSDVSEKHGNFDLVKRVKLDFTDVVVSKWKSRVTGLSVVHLDYEGESRRTYKSL